MSRLAPFALLLAAGFLGSSAVAETSSWVQRGSAPQNQKPAPNAPAAQKGKAPPAAKPATARSEPMIKVPAAISIPETGDNAAYIAFDQGQFLTALRIAEKAAKRSDPQAHTLIGRIYAEGAGVSRNEALAAA